MLMKFRTKICTKLRLFQCKNQFKFSSLLIFWLIKSNQMLLFFYEFYYSNVNKLSFKMNNRPILTDKLTFHNIVFDGTFN